MACCLVLLVRQMTSFRTVTLLGLQSDFPRPLRCAIEMFLPVRRRYCISPLLLMFVTLLNICIHRTKDSGPIAVPERT